MSDSGRERDREKELIINYNKQSLPINNCPTYIHKSLAFPATPELVQLLSDLDVMARRDGWSFCQLVSVALQEYREHHPLPNPQAQIDRMLEVKMPLKPTNKCCVPNCNRKTRWLLRLQNDHMKCQEFQVCASHKRWLHSEFRRLVSYREMR